MIIDLGDRLSNMKISLYREGTSTPFDAHKVAEYLSSKIGVEANVHTSFWKYTKDTAEELATVRVTPTSPGMNNHPTPMEIQLERKMLESGKIIGCIVYDGFAIQRIALKTIPEPERVTDHLHIIFTDRLLATYERLEMRYHLRTILCGYPSLISITGLIEAPARTKKVHIMRRWGIVTDDYSMKDDHLDYDDPRITSAATGYALQALSYYLFEEPFCQVPFCRLYDAHTQEKMLKAQFCEPELCEKHQDLLKSERRTIIEESERRTKRRTNIENIAR